MKKIIDYVRLTRPLNLLFIVVIQFLMARAVLFPLLKGFSIEEQLLPTPILILIVLATVLTAAGGYVINDYFDIKIDRINRPEKVIITTSIDKSSAMRFYQILTFVGTALGLLGAFLLRNTTLALLFVIVPGLLWFYSASYKRQFLIGNLAVAFCAALVPLTIIFAQNAFFELKYASLIYETPILKICYGWIGGFALFAFLVTLLREIIKDLQDEYGDREMECRTLPIKLGTKRAKAVIYTLLVVIVALLSYFVFYKIKFEGSSLTERYFVFGIVLPLIFVAYLTYNAKTANDYKTIGNLTKFVMLIGTLYSLVFLFLKMATLG